MAPSWNLNSTFVPATSPARSRNALGMTTRPAASMVANMAKNTMNTKFQFESAASPVIAHNDRRGQPPSCPAAARFSMRYHLE